MNHIWKILLCFFCSCCLISSAGADLDFFSRLNLSNMKYAENIEVRTYLVTREQLAEFFKSEYGTVTQKTNAELYQKELFLLVRCRNKGNYKSFGIINFSLPNSDVELDILFMPGLMQSFQDSILYIGSGIIFSNNETPIITYKWKDLYTI